MKTSSKIILPYLIACNFSRGAFIWLESLREIVQFCLFSYMFGIGLFPYMFCIYKLRFCAMLELDDRALI